MTILIKKMMKIIKKNKVHKLLFLYLIRFNIITKELIVVILIKKNKIK